MMSLHGTVAIVIGGTSGIGKATCLQLAKQGAKVIVGCFGNELSAEAIVSEIVAHGGEAVSIPADPRSSEQMERLADAVMHAFGRIDVLVCNASHSAEAASFAELSWDSFEQQLTGELKAAFEPTKAVIPVMTAQQFGRIIYLSSTEGKDPSPPYIAFGTAKGGLDAFARYIAQEFGPDGITANVVASGFVRTDGPFTISEDEGRVIGSLTPLRRIAEPEDVAGMISFLAGDGARFLTGTYTPVTGGLVME
ncbi:3-oxoacyl-[acyl-carrier protein] reductase [Paenibacillus catalpae]|uniref:3-oxoacyl-[acyl-carrier protein] reductase n=1 Tax=Paenibacillus catalpae TaxID=1045775 RepID=A0A1I2GKQ1_9BACL|nr:SDR family oxidoreductase [Paenibacillus catalpae]SFF17181.1 3-oxoacyl-[acyl-carrier protein] reductase [Paenibacillus catalpae]